MEPPGLRKGICEESLERSRLLLPEVTQRWTLRPETDFQAYLETFSAKLAQADAEASGLRWRLQVLRDAVPNVFSVGGGDVFLTEGLILAAENEHEIAAVIAHEMAHELEGHFCPSSEEPRGDEETHRVGNMVQVINAEHERAADRRAVALLQAAGFDPQALVTFTRRQANEHPDAVARQVLAERLDSLVNSVKAAGPSRIYRPPARGRLKATQTTLRQ